MIGTVRLGWDLAFLIAVTSMTCGCLIRIAWRGQKRLLALVPRARTRAFIAEGDKIFCGLRWRTKRRHERLVGVRYGHGFLESEAEFPQVQNGITRINSESMDWFT